MCHYVLSERTLTFVVLQYTQSSMLLSLHGPLPLDLDVFPWE